VPFNDVLFFVGTVTGQETSGAFTEELMSLLHCRLQQGGGCGFCLREYHALHKGI
jgi:hypothetical protein